jgi:hypothetical protein
MNREEDMNPIWQHMIFKAVKEVMRVCTHCKRAAAYPQKKAGQFYKCKFCGHRFKEKER